MIMLRTHTVNFPIKLKKPPNPPVKMKAPEFFRIKMNPFIAAMQKHSPVSATWQYAFKFTYLMNLWQHARQHLQHEISH